MGLSLAQKLTYGFILAVGVGVGGEVGTRAYDRIKNDIPFAASPSMDDLITHDSVGARGTPNGHFGPFRLNSAGFRSSESTLATSPGCIRVMTLGASETLGTGAGAAGNEYPAQLQDSLSVHGCYKVLNAGIQGIGLRSLIHFWNGWASRFHPDVVVILATPTMYLLDPVPPYVSGKQRVQSPPGFQFSSRLVGHIQEHIHYPGFILRQRVQNHLDALTAGRSSEWYYSNVPVDRVALLRHDLDSLVTVIRASGSTPVLGAYAMRFGRAIVPEDSALVAQWREYAPRAEPGVLIDFGWAARDATLELGRERGVVTVDLPAVLNGHAELFDDYAHFTAAGASVVAGMMARGVLAASSADGTQPR